MVQANRKVSDRGKHYHVELHLPVYMLYNVFYYIFVFVFSRSYVYLSNLLLPSSLVYRVAVVSEKGEVRGHLTVSIRYLSGEHY